LHARQQDFLEHFSEALTADDTRGVDLGIGRLGDEGESQVRAFQRARGEGSAPSERAGPSRSRGETRTMSPTSLNFDLGDDVDRLRQLTQQFASREVAPLAAKADAENTFPNPLWRQFGELGLLGLTVEEEYGGTHLGYLAHVVAMEEISRACAAVGLSYGAHSNLCVNQLRKNGSAAQKQQYLPGLISGEHIGDAPSLANT
jgi:hypothetical protein